MSKNRSVKAAVAAALASATLGIGVLSTSAPALAAGRPDAVEITRKVNEYEGQHRKVNEYEGQRHVNEYEGQHR